MNDVSHEFEYIQYCINRWFGNGAFFLTMAPSSWKYGLFYQLADAKYSNCDPIYSDIPKKNSERKAIKINSPYADSIMFLRHSEAIINKMLKVPQESALTRKADNTIQPWTTRERGLFGCVNGVYTASETSAEGIVHTHSKVYIPMDWNFIDKVSLNVFLNKSLGEFMDSIISNELSSLRAFEREPKFTFQEPTKVWLSVEETLTPETQTKLPIFPTTEMSSSSSLPVIEEFWIQFEEIAYTVQNHGNHNFSCWKNGSEICRFKFPNTAWNEISGFIQLDLKPAHGLQKETYYIGSRVSTFVEKPLFKADQRCIISNSSKRTDDGVTLRDPTESEKHGVSIACEFLDRTDTGRNNGLISPCSAIILICCGGGGGCHNNLQHIGKGGMGDASYIAKYITKGIGGQLTACLPLLHEAILANKTSVHPDVVKNPHRHALYLMQKSINNANKRSEFSMQLMLLSLLGLQQFSSSHKFQYIPVNLARQKAFENLKKAKTTTVSMTEELDVSGVEILKDNYAPISTSMTLNLDTVDVDSVDSEESIQIDHLPKEDAIEEEVVYLDDLKNRSSDRKETFDLDEEVKNDFVHASGTLVKVGVSGNELVVVSLVTDYENRGEKLKMLSFMEFCLLLEKNIEIEVM